MYNLSVAREINGRLVLTAAHLADSLAPRLILDYCPVNLSFDSNSLPTHSPSLKPSSQAFLMWTPP